MQESVFDKCFPETKENRDAAVQLEYFLKDEESAKEKARDKHQGKLDSSENLQH